MVLAALIDDDSELSMLLADFLESDSRFGKLLTFDSGAPALEAARRGRFAVVLVDLRLPNDSGLRWIRRLRESCPGLKILAYTGVEEDESIITAIEAGADGFLVKGDPLKDVADAVVQAAAGVPVASAPVLRALFRNLRRDSDPSTNQELSRAEVRVLELSALGYDCKTVAKKLGISVQTVYVHNRRIFRKLGVTNRLAAIAKFHEKPTEQKF